MDPAFAYNFQTHTYILEHDTSLYLFIYLFILNKDYISSIPFYLKETREVISASPSIGTAVMNKKVTSSTSSGPNSTIIFPGSRVISVKETGTSAFPTSAVKSNTASARVPCNLVMTTMRLLGESFWTTSISGSSGGKLLPPIGKSRRRPFNSARSFWIRSILVSRGIHPTSVL